MRVAPAALTMASRKQKEMKMTYRICYDCLKKRPYNYGAFRCHHGRLVWICFYCIDEDGF